MVRKKITSITGTLKTICTGKELLCISSILCIGYLMRLHNYSGHGIWQDELTTIWQVYHNYYEHTADAPLFKTLLQLCKSVSICTNVDTFRLFAIHLSMLVPIAAYFYVRSIADRAKAFAALLVLSCIGSSFLFAINLRPYALFSLISLLTYHVYFLYQTGKNVQLPLFIVLTIAAFTHLLSVHIYSAICLAYICNYLLAKKQVPGFLTQHFTSKGLLQLVIIVVAAGSIGALWALERYSKFIGSAVHAPANTWHYILHVVDFLPIGTRIPLWLSLCLWVSFIFGIRYVAKKHPPYALFIAIFSCIVLLVCWATYGSRTGWDSPRYFSHLLVLYSCIIGIGIDELRLFVQKKLAIPYICTLFYIGITCMFIYQTMSVHSSIYARNDRMKNFYMASIASNTDGIIVSKKSRTSRLMAFFQETEEDSKPLYEVRQKIYTFTHQHDIEEYTTTSKEITASTIAPGLFLSNLPCTTLNTMLQRSVTDYVFVPSQKHTNATGIFYCSLLLR